jgi:hypothetical protein
MVTDRPEGFLISPAPKGHHEIAQGKAKRRPGCIPGFFPTVAWHSEAVRVREDSITFIQKRVADPFYRPKGARRSVSVCSVCSVVQRRETGDSPRAMEEALLIQSKPKRSVLRGLG